MLLECVHAGGVSASMEVMVMLVPSGRVERKRGIISFPIVMVTYMRPTEPTNEGSEVC